MSQVLMCLEFRDIT